MIMRVFTLLIVSLPLFSFSQKVELHIKDFDTKQPVIAATIAYKNKPIAKSNAVGKALIDLEYRIVMVYAMGFDSTEVVLGGTNQIVYLYKKDNKLKEVIVKPWIDEFANSLIRKMMDKAKDNHPDRLSSYQFYTYSKFTADAKEDTGKMKKDTSNIKKEMKDSFDLKEASDYMKNNKLFVWERLTVFKHDKSLGTKKVLLNSNMSGFKMPIYELLAITLDEVNFLPRMFRSEAYKEYYFRLEDSMQMEGRKTYTVAFYPFKRSKNKRSRHGYVRIDAENYGCMAYKGTTKQGFFELNNQLVEGKVFTKDMFVNLTNSMIQMGNFSTNTIYKLTVQSLEVPKSFNKSDFKGYDAEISPSLNDKKSNEILAQLRGSDSLDQREKNTFVSLDSLVRKNNIENKLRLLLALRNGNIKLGKFNLDLVDLMQFNQYEGFRMNIAGETNFSFHPKLSFRGKLGYGFGDQRFKYQLGTSYLFSYQNQSKVSILYENDVFAAGRTFQSLSTKLDYFNHLVNLWYFGNFYQSHSVKASFQSDLHKYLEQKISLQYENVSVKFPYIFKGLDMTNTNFMNANLELNYYPKTKFIVTPEGKFKIQSRPTIIKVNYAYRHPQNSSFSPYHTLNLEGQTSISHPLGKTNGLLHLGYIQGDASIISLYEGRGSSRRNTNLISTFDFGSYQFFETMEPSSFYSDRYAAIFIKHQIPAIKVGVKYELQLSLIYKALFGDISKPNDHSLPLEAPSKLYQETGLEWDQIVKKLPIGLGLYYRFGAYHRGEFTDNFAARLLIKL
jgi:hypothetical protein